LMNLVTSANNYEKGVRDDIANFKALGCISITELAHGSNTKELKTTATYDLNKQKFILNTPSLEATKVWSGVLGQTATHGIVFAQLYTPDGRCHGLHSFMIPLRDPKTLLPYPGVCIGDMGPKIGLNGVDNGFMVFNNYEVGKETLMNRNAHISETGEYVAKIKDENKRFGLQLGILSVGRVFINLMSLTNIQMAITISIRYSCVRKQFGPTQQLEQITDSNFNANHDESEQKVQPAKIESKLHQEGNNLETILHFLGMDKENYERKEVISNEVNVIEYQIQQWRLAPYVAAFYVLHNFHFSFYRDYVDFFVTAYALSNDPEKEAAMGSEVHSLSSVAKAVVSWLARDCIQESRECCGGQGYLKSARLGDLRGDNDANLTYEGDNNVLLQQTSNYLLRNFKEKLETNKKMASPFQTLNSLDDFEHILTTKYTETNWLNLTTILNAYNFLVCYLLKESYEKVQTELKKHNQCMFTAKNLSQVYYLRSLAIAHFEQNALKRFIHFLNEQEQDTPAEIVDVLQKLGQLYGLWSLEKHLSTLYDANYFKEYNGKPSTELHQAILSLCEQLKDNLVSLVDAIAPDDFVLNSSLGMSDGNIYHHIFESLSKSQGAFDRPAWYTEFTNEQAPKAKL